MRDTIRRKLEQCRERREELGLLLSDPTVTADAARFQALSREYARVGAVAQGLDEYEALERRLLETETLARHADPDLRALAVEELEALRVERAARERDLLYALLPADPRDDANVYLEVRAGTGGDEAAIFAGDLLRMYLRYAERRGWRTELISDHPGEHGGSKQAVVRIEGPGAYGRLKFESGTHRVQRVPETEAQGRIHTSAATVAILPEVDEIEDFELDPTELKIDTFRASGAGGQHVNKTESAIRIQHLPSGIVVECQDERSQHKNRARALALLKAHLLEHERERQRTEQNSLRRAQVGSGDRSQRIRTYNFPQGRLTDHRIQLTLYKLEAIIDGDLDPVIEPLLHEHRAEQLKELLDAPAGVVGA